MKPSRTGSRRRSRTLTLGPEALSTCSPGRTRRRGWKRSARDLDHIVRDLHAHPEEAFEEHHAQAVIAGVLERHGFQVERGAHGVSTSVRAEWSSADYDSTVHPTVAVLAEYDALPGIGHACGHNVIAAAGVGAFLGAVGSGSGRIVFLGTPRRRGTPARST